MLLVLAISLALAAQLQSPMPQTSSLTEAQQAGLRGKVKTCSEQQTYPSADGQPERTSWTKTEYSPDGKLLLRRVLNPDGSVSELTRSYDAQGRLLKIASGVKGTKQSEEIYQYDPKGRLIGSTVDGQPSNTTYEYDERGHKTKIQRADSSSFPVGTRVAYAVDGSMVGRNIPPGGTVATIYNEHDEPIEGQFRDAKGQIVTRIIFRYDANGNVISEEHASESGQGMVTDEMRSELNQAQVQGLGAWIAETIGSTKIAYSYDAEGRLIGKRTQSMGTETTTISYNEHGDKVREATTAVMDPTMGVDFSIDHQGNVLPQTPPKPQPPQEAEARYEYEYDGQGNWIEMKATHTSKSPVPSQQSEIHRRELTYY